MSTATTDTRLLGKYLDEVLPAMMSEYNITNKMAAPTISKVVVSMGVGEARENKTALDAAANDLTRIVGQKAAITRARLNISNFKLREDMPIGCRVTLRGPRMWEFLDRLISVVIPRIKDFRGLRTKLDGRGNYSMGLSDQTVFPEIDLDRIKFHQGMNITIVTTAESDPLGFDLLKRLGMPFRHDDKAEK
jgi:large subunit ribosomal protein L5